MSYITTQSYWLIDQSSEAIEFSGCDYDGITLHIGRFYFQNDMLIQQTIWKKRKEFTDWADKVFGAVKKCLPYSKPLDAYIGHDAEIWKNVGGKFKQI
jgi:hypothetical protein